MRFTPLLKISLILYLPMLAAVAAVFFGDFRPDSLGSPLAKALFLLWALDGLLCLVSGVAVIMALLRGEAFENKAFHWVLSIFGSVMGLLPAFILVELFYKLLLYLF